MYNVTFKNDYIYSVFADKQEIKKGTTGKVTNWGSHVVDIPGMGPLNFIDLGERKLPEWTNPHLPWTELTWGGLVRYRGIDFYFRYEGQGELGMRIDAEGCVHIDSVKGGGMIVSLDDLTVGEHEEG